MLWFTTMMATVFGVYVKGHQWASRTQVDPVLTAVSGLSEQITEYGRELRDVAARVSVLEAKDSGKANI